MIGEYSLSRFTAGLAVRFAAKAPAFCGRQAPARCWSRIPNDKILK